MWLQMWQVLMTHMLAFSKAKEKKISLSWVCHQPFKHGELKSLLLNFYLLMDILLFPLGMEPEDFLFNDIYSKKSTDFKC